MQLKISHLFLFTKILRRYAKQKKNNTNIAIEKRYLGDGRTSKKYVEEEEEEEEEDHIKNRERNSSTIYRYHVNAKQGEY